jgi:endoglucanase
MTGLHGMTRTTRRRAVAAVSACALAASGLVGLIMTPAHAQAGCEVEFNASEWGDGNAGFTAQLAITNLGDPISGWTLEFALPGNASVTEGWSADWSQSGQNVTATDMGWNANLGQTQIGFNGTGFAGAPSSFTLNGVTCNGQPPPTTEPPPTTDPPPPAGEITEIVAEMQPGWNLGNSLDSVGPDETAWGNPRVTQALIQNVAAEGFNSIRIPVTWNEHQGSAPTYTIEAAWLDRVEEVVDWALAADLYVMINVHHDSWLWVANMTNDQTNVLNRFNATWTQVADTFQDKSAKLVFESINEPQFNNASDAQGVQLLDQLNTSFHQIVRGSGGNNATRPLVLPTLHTNDGQQFLDGLNSTIDSLNDPNLIATVHYYGFWPFSVNIAGFTTFNQEVQQELVNAFDRVQNAFISRGIPVIIGEYGLLGFDVHTGTIEQGEKLKYFEFFGNAARTRGITTQLWDNGQHFGRSSFQWSDPELIAQTKSSWTERSGTASSDRVFVERSSTITDETLTLNLNGTSFQGLREGNTDLVEGSDYAVSGNQLTITASALTELVGSQEYGVNANLHADFSQGVPWRISVTTFDTPILQDATGSTGSFTIPAQFRGDLLATMEAVYVDGAIAGPQNWTSFKEFGRTFSPDYGSNTLALTPDFFAEVDDNREVTLTFHFWSGETVTYSVTKSGGSVTGTAG